MPLFSIRRDVPGATQEDLDASAYRALVCANAYKGMRWIRSYWDRENGQILCLYEARSREDLIQHSERSRIPCDEVREIMEILPGDYLGATPGAGVAAAVS